MDSKFIEVLNLVADGLSVTKACEKVGVTRRLFYDRLKEHEDLRYNYARAIELRADRIFDDILLIADETSSDKRSVNDEKEVTDNEAIQRSKLRVDARKWVLSRMNPKKYGDRLNVDHDAENKGNPPNLIWREKPKV
jgi:hypothetical protein